MKFLFLTENEILLFSFSGCFLFSFSLKIFLEIQPNTFSSPFSVFSENENKKQPNQTSPKVFKIERLNVYFKIGDENYEF